MQDARTLKPPADRTLNRLIVAVVLILLIGIPLIGVIYFMDRYATASQPIVDRQITTLEEAVRKTPNLTSVRLQLAGAYTAAKRYDDATAQYNEVLRVKKDSKDALMGLGDVLVLKGDLAGAIKPYEAVVDQSSGGEFAGTDTQLQAAYYDLGSIALQQKHPADAVPLLVNALKIDRGDADTLNLLGSAFAQTGKAKEAVEALRGAVLYVPVGWCEPYQTLTGAYTTLGQAAESTWASAMVAFCTKQPDVAKQQLTGLLNGPAATDAALGLGFVAEAEGDRTAAADWFRKVLKADSSNFLAQNGLTRVTDPNPPSAHPSIPAASPATGGNS